MHLLLREAIKQCMMNKARLTRTMDAPVGVLKEYEMVSPEIKQKILNPML